VWFLEASCCEESACRDHQLQERKLIMLIEQACWLACRYCRYVHHLTLDGVSAMPPSAVALSSGGLEHAVLCCVRWRFACPCLHSCLVLIPEQLLLRAPKGATRQRSSAAASAEAVLVADLQWLPDGSHARTSFRFTIGRLWLMAWRQQSVCGGKFTLWHGWYR
jgi:hypothetical protein